MINKQFNNVVMNELGRFICPYFIERSYMKWQYRKRSILRALLVLCCSFILFVNTSISGYCNTTTESGVGSWFIYTCKDFLQRYWDANVRFVTKYWVVLNSDDMVGTFSDFIDWMLTNHPDVDLDDETYDVQQTPDGDFIVNNDVKNYLNDYMIYEVQQNPLGYSQAYINGWGLISPDRFANEKQYKALQDYIKAQDQPCFVRTFGNFQQTICVAPLSFEYDLGFVGDVSGRVFTNVKAYDGWSEFFPVKEDFKFVNADGSVTDMGYVDGGFRNGYIYNGNMSNPVSPGYYVISNDSNKELVYVYKTLTDLKRYNSGYPQRYYLTEDGLNGIYNPDLGNLNVQNINYYGSNYEYNQIINNIYPGMSPDDVLKLVTEILKQNGGGSGGGSGGGGSDTDVDLGFLGTIGTLIGKLINGIGQLLTGIIGGIVDTIMSLIDMITGENGIISKLTDLFDTNVGGFLTSIFDWLPPEIVTLWSAGIILGILFGILRIIRG